MELSWEELLHYLVRTPEVPDQTVSVSPRLPAVRALQGPLVYHGQQVLPVVGTGVVGVQLAPSYKVSFNIKRFLELKLNVKFE